jgi:DNA-binding transcriptional regulator YhcF (GntR family)
MQIVKLIKINENSRVPKYRQIVDSIIQNITDGKLKIDQKLPSINMFSEEFYLSRDTVEKAYGILKDRKIITAIRGKGFYITETKLVSKINILFLMNKLSTYKMQVHNSFVNSIGVNSRTDLQIYHCDENLFLDLLDKNKHAYDYYLIMSHFKTNSLKHVSYTDDVLKAINEIPREKLVLLDNINLETDGDLVAIYQDFENDIYDALKECIIQIKRYTKIMLIYPDKSVYPFPRRILHGFKNFCSEYDLDFEVLNEIYDDMILKRGDLFITIEESDLVNLVKQTRENEYILGSDIGIISYNDTPLKELLGITVISTDFKVMGETAANMILNKKKGKIKVPFNFINRESL